MNPCLPAVWTKLAILGAFLTRVIAAENAAPHFTDITATAGIDQPWAVRAAWGDFDRDGITAAEPEVRPDENAINIRRRVSDGPRNGRHITRQGFVCGTAGS